VQRLQKI